jgi:hypothetical protein
MHFPSLRPTLYPNCVKYTTGHKNCNHKNNMKNRIFLEQHQTKKPIETLSLADLKKIQKESNQLSKLEIMNLKYPALL